MYLRRKLRPRQVDVRGPLLLHELHDVVGQLVRATRSRLVRQKSGQTFAVEGRLRLVERLSGEAKRARDGRHRLVIDTHATQHLVLDLEQVVRVEERVVGEERIGDRVRVCVQKSVSLQRPMLGSALRFVCHGVEVSASEAPMSLVLRTHSRCIDSATRQALEPSCPHMQSMCRMIGYKPTVMPLANGMIALTIPARLPLHIPTLISPRQHCGRLLDQRRHLEQLRWSEQRPACRIDLEHIHRPQARPAHWQLV